MADHLPTSIAKSMIEAYGERNWEGLWSIVDSRIEYDKIATRRKTSGIRGFMTILQDWANAFPDSKIEIGGSRDFGNTVILDLRWTGTHEGNIEAPGGVIFPTGKKIDLPATMVFVIGERESGIRASGGNEPVEREVSPPRVMSISHYFDMAALEKQLERSPEEKVA